MSQSGIRIAKVLGLAALIGVLIAVGRIVLRVFNEKSGEPDESQGA
jgi:hypothetical protein